MGTARVKVSRDALQECIYLLSRVGWVASVEFPSFWLDQHTIVVTTDLVPDGETRDAFCEVSIARDEPGRAQLTVQLKLVEDPYKLTADLIRSQDADKPSTLAERTAAANEAMSVGYGDDLAKMLASKYRA